MEYSDIIFAGDNLPEFISIAEKLKFSRIFTCSKNYNHISLPNKNNEYDIHNSRIEIITSEFTNTSPTTKSGLTLYSATNNIREVIERDKIDVLYGAEGFEKKDRLHYRKSGLNHIICKLAREKGVIIAFSFSSLLAVNGVTRSIILGRMRQNIHLCKKYHNQICLASLAESPYEMRSPLDLIAFGALIGLHPSEAKKAVFIDRQII